MACLRTEEDVHLRADLALGRLSSHELLPSISALADNLESVPGTSIRHHTTFSKT